MAHTPGRPQTGPSVIYASQGSTAPQMALERDIVHMIIERETCLEALLQVTPHFRNPHSKVRPWKVIQNLTLQYRRASVEVTEGIAKWRALIGVPRQGFIWKHANYLHKMTTDAAFATSVPEMFRDFSFSLADNPFLAPFSLRHEIFRLDDAAMLAKARLVCSEIGGVDIDRICAASKLLIAEGVLLPLELPATVAPVTTPALPPVRKTSPRPAVIENQELPQELPSIPEFPLNHEPAALAPHDKLLLMKVHLDHAKAKLQSLEADRTDLTARMADVAAKIENTTLPSKLRLLQNSLGALNNSLKALSGEIFQRRNELTRQQAAYRLQASKTKRPRPHISIELDYVVAEDQRARDELVAELQNTAPAQQAPSTLEYMNESQVYEFIKELGLQTCAEKLRNMGIDGPLLAVSTDQDLQELGIEVRLQRVKILREVEKRLKDAR
ncbi:hypothetical protein ACHHYP_15243 [Achlya hypogyna]|uniref:SAM domain-containing protein n=1 Tax=Achlya hypogyna TaxID=1202772 RepID=A0A1V9YBB3_ACHHY|nr:hypothetical protein ACHHYP_15243 [Achlya hypogyna]